jgi:hypothetical protein
VKSFQRIIFLITMIILLGLPQQLTYALIRPDIRLDTVSVHLLPEYTHPTVMVIYEIDLDETLPLPQDLTFTLPADAQIIAVINFTTGNRPTELTYQEARIGNWKDLQFTSTTHRIRIEYQDPNLVRQHNDRMYEFQWLSIYPVTSLSISVRQPMGASNIQSQPLLWQLDDRPEEQPVFTRGFGNISAGELFTLSFSYNKDTSDPAYPALPVEPARPINGNASGRTPSPVGVILWMLVVGVVIVTIVGLYYLRFRLKEAEKFEFIGQGVGIMNPERQTFFCQECGMRASVGDSYCSNCGTELRKPTPFEQPPATNR